MENTGRVGIRIQMPARRPSRDGEQAIACVSVHLRGESEMKIEMARYQHRAVFKAMATNGESDIEKTRAQDRDQHFPALARP